MLALLPLAVFAFWIGIVPATFLRPIGPAVEQVAGPIDAEFQKYYAATPVVASTNPSPPSLTLRVGVAGPSDDSSIPTRSVSEGGASNAP